MITPKEKAKELFDKYVELSGIFVGDYESEKEMCLITIDEILNELQLVYNEDRINFYLEIKLEITKL